MRLESQKLGSVIFLVKKIVLKSCILPVLTCQTVRSIKTKLLPWRQRLMKPETEASIEQARGETPLPGRNRRHTKHTHP
jgi:hypothetical protein